MPLGSRHGITLRAVGPMQNEPYPPTLVLPPATNSPEYPLWLMRQLGQKLKAERLAQGLSAMQLACREGAQLSDETVFNNERGLKNVGLMTLCRHAQALGADVVDYLAELRRGWTPPR